jgi:hypothetical protein
MTFPNRRYFQSIVLAAIGLAVAVTGIYIGETDDAPGAAVLGIAVMLGLMFAAVRRKNRADGMER